MQASRPLRQLPRLIVAAVIVALTLSTVVLVLRRPPGFAPTAHKLGASGDPSVRVWTRIETADQGSFPGSLWFAITGVDLYSRLAAGGSEACIESATLDLVTAALPEPLGLRSRMGRVFYHRHVFTPTDTCPCVAFDPEPDWRSYRSAELNWRTEIETDLLDHAYYFYPFDRMVIRGEIVTNVRVTDSSGRVVSEKEVPSSHTLAFDLRGWEIGTTTTRMQLYSERNETPDNAARAALVVQRPLLVRILVPAVLLVLFFVILAMPFVETFHSKLEIAVAVVIGLVGARQALLPAGSPSFLAADALLLVELLVVALPVACHPLSKPLGPGPAKDTASTTGPASIEEVTAEEKTSVQALPPSPSTRRTDLSAWFLLLGGTGAAVVLYRLWKSRAGSEK